MAIICDKCDELIPNTYGFYDYVMDTVNHKNYCWRCYDRMRIDKAAEFANSPEGEEFLMEALGIKLKQEGEDNGTEL